MTTANATPPLPSPETDPAQRWEPATRFYRQVHLVALGLLIFVLLVHLLRDFADIFQQLFIAVFLVYVILPAHRWLVQRRVPSLVAYFILMAAMLGLCLVLGIILYANFEDLNEKLPHYRRNLHELVENITERIPWLNGETVQKLLGANEASMDKGMGMMRSALGAFFGFGRMLVVVVYLVFLIAERHGLARRIQTGFPPARAAAILDIVNRINASIEEYIVVKTFVSFLTGIGTSVVLWLFGVDYAALWGIVAFLLNFIPYLGSLIAVVLPVALSVVQLQSVPTSAAILVTLFVVHNTIGLLIEPWLTGHRLHLSPSVIVVALAFWGSLWGIVGMILAVPLVVVMTSILGNIAETKPLAVVMSND